MKYCYEEKKKRLCTIFAVIFVCIAGFLYLFSSYIRKDFDTENSDGLILESDNSVGGKQSSEEIADVSDSGKSDVKASEKVVVYVCGAVVSEGVYELEAGSRIDDAVNAAGGFAKTAARDYLNLAEPVTDGEKIVVYTKKEVKNTTVSDGKTKNNDDAESSRININTAPKEELMKLPGIGASKADDIISYREANGGFKSVEDLKNISGIKDGVYSKIADSITAQ